MDLERELAELKARKRNVRPEELHRLLTAAGFVRSYGKGDHWKYHHVGIKLVVVVDPRSPLLVAYVTRAIAAMEEVLHRER